MNLRHLRTFVQVVRDGSLYKAAESLGYAQATVSQQIQQLERDLGVEVFTRNGKRIVTAPAGVALYEQAVDLLERADVLETKMRNFGAGNGGVLRVGAIEPAATTRVAPLLARFCSTRKDVTAVFEVGGVESLSGLIESGRLDVAVTSAPPGRSKFTFEPLFEEMLYAVIPAGHALSRKATVSLGDLLNYPMVLTDPSCAYRRAFDSTMHKHKRNIAPVLQVSSASALRVAVETGMGIGMLPKGARSMGSTVFKRVSDAKVSLTVGLLSRRDADFSPIVTRFVELLRANLRS